MDDANNRTGSIEYKKRGKSKIMIMDCTQIGIKSPKSRADIPIKNIIFKINETRKQINSSHQARRRQSHNESYDYGNRTNNCSKDNSFFVNKLKTQIKYTTERPEDDHKDDILAKCSKFLQRREDDLPYMLLNQMRVFHPAKETRSILRTPYSKGFELFKHQSRIKEFIHKGRKLSECRNIL